MQPISVEAFASMVMKNNKGYRKKELVKMLNDTLTAKKNGAKCMVRRFGRREVPSLVATCALPAQQVKQMTATIMR